MAGFIRRKRVFGGPVLDLLDRVRNRSDVLRVSSRAMASNPILELRRTVHLGFDNQDGVCSKNCVSVTVSRHDKQRSQKVVGSTEHWYSDRRAVMANSWGGTDIVIAGAATVPGYYSPPRKQFDKPMLEKPVRPNRAQRRAMRKGKRKCR